KLLGFTNGEGKTARDTDLLRSLVFKKANHLLLIGSTDKQLLEAAKAYEASLAQQDLVINDLNEVYIHRKGGSLDEEEEWIRTPLHLSRLSKAIERTKVKLLHPPRQGKKLLVLDLDYTLFDCKSC
ncbi:had family iiid protein, partial [Cystoisospora suis]